MIRGELDGRQYCLVAMKTVSRQFIWEDAERVYFCFDSMLMLRTMMDDVRSSRLMDRSPSARAVNDPGSVTAAGRQGYSEIVWTTLETGRALTVGSLTSLASSSSYCGSICTGVFARIATTL